MNMKTVHYQIRFFSYWHTGSGLSGGAYTDLLVNKTKQNLPFIPGRTLKGLFREAGVMVNGFDSSLVSQDFIYQVFGESPDENKMQKELYTKEALSYFSNANLSEHATKGIIENEKQPFLYEILASTKIDKQGLAEDGTLRQMEVTIPLTLYGMIDHFPDRSDFIEQLAYCMSWVKRLGLNRNRGLGRCEFSIIKITEA